MKKNLNRKLFGIFCMMTMIFLMSGSVLAAKIEYYGHRGLTDQYPENTLVSLKGAMNAGFDGVEFDMFQTKDSELMVFHDSTLARMCKTDGWIYDVTKENRTQYPIKNGSNIKKYKRLLIPTFEEVVKCMAKKC